METRPGLSAGPRSGRTLSRDPPEHPSPSPSVINWEAYARPPFSGYSIGSCPTRGRIRGASPPTTCSVTHGGPGCGYEIDEGGFLPVPSTVMLPLAASTCRSPPSDPEEIRLVPPYQRAGGALTSSWRMPGSRVADTRGPPLGCRRSEGTSEGRQPSRCVARRSASTAPGRSRELDGRSGCS